MIVIVVAALAVGAICSRPTNQEMSFVRSPPPHLIVGTQLDSLSEMTLDLQSQDSNANVAGLSTTGVDVNLKSNQLPNYQFNLEPSVLSNLWPIRSTNLQKQGW